MSYGEKNPLVGMVVESVALSDDRSTITFRIADGAVVTAETEGDCCSYTWIENIDDMSALVGRTVIAVEDIDMPNLGDIGTEFHGDVESVAYYGTRITADNGETFVIDYRNDSNGYYGGSLTWRLLSPPSTAAKVSGGGGGDYLTVPLP